MFPSGRGLEHVPVYQSGGFAGATRLAEARSVGDESEHCANDRHEEKCDKRSELALIIEIVDNARA